MDIAIVTGASSALGLAISNRLIQLGFRVYGLGGDYSKCPLQNVNFKPVSCDLADPAAVEAAARRILEKEQGILVVINNAKYFGQAPFAEMENADMERILRINLLCPLVLVRTLAPSLKALQGYLIQLGAPFSESSRGGAVGAAASGGLKWMGEVLFQELRAHGVKVCHLSPEPNRLREGRTAARPGARTEASIDPEALAQAIEQILQSPYGNVITELVLRPLRTREPDLEPVRHLPSPDPQPVPYTVPREYIEAEEQLEEETWQKNQEDKRKRRRDKAQSKPPSDSSAAAAARKQQTGGKADPPASRQKEEKADAETAPAASPQEGGQRRKRRGGRKPRPPKPNVGFSNKEGEAPPKDSSPEKPASPKEEEKPAPPAKKASQKRTAKKAATKKTAPRKKRARKAAKKGTRKTTGQQDGEAPEESAGNGKDSA